LQREGKACEHADEEDVMGATKQCAYCGDLDHDWQRCPKAHEIVLTPEAADRLFGVPVGSLPPIMPELLEKESPCRR
jgi:hypothetical protein